MFPQIPVLLHTLNWWTDAAGDYFCRRDEYGDIRRFRLGFDSMTILHEWLCNFHRVHELRTCSRVLNSLHRGVEGLAMGLQLPGPQPGGMCLFAYHKIAWESSGTKHLHHAAFFACLSSFTDRCTAHKQQFREQKKKVW